MTLSLAPARPGGHPQSVFVRLADILVGHDVVEHAGNNDIEHNKHYDVDIQNSAPKSSIRSKSEGS